MLLVTFFGTHAAIGGEAYEELARLYDYPARLGRDAVPVCFGHGCSSVRRIALQPADWQQVTRPFAQAAVDAAGEREQIRHAIAEMERVAGRLADTADDRAGDIGDSVYFDRSSTASTSRPIPRPIFRCSSRLACSNGTVCNRSCAGLLPCRRLAAPIQPRARKRQRRPMGRRLVVSRQRTAAGCRRPRDLEGWLEACRFVF